MTTQLTIRRPRSMYPRHLTPFTLGRVTTEHEHVDANMDLSFCAVGAVVNAFVPGSWSSSRNSLTDDVYASEG